MRKSRKQTEQASLFQKTHSSVRSMTVTYENDAVTIMYPPFKLLDIASLQNAKRIILQDSDYKYILLLGGKL